MDELFLVFHEECGAEPVRIFDDLDLALRFMYDNKCCGIAKVSQIINEEKGTFTYTDPELVEGYIPDDLEDIDLELKDIDLD